MQIFFQCSSCSSEVYSIYPALARLIWEAFMKSDADCKLF